MVLTQLTVQYLLGRLLDKENYPHIIAGIIKKAYLSRRSLRIHGLANSTLMVVLYQLVSQP
jgi:hypothetical protein